MDRFWLINSATTKTQVILNFVIKVKLWQVIELKLLIGLSMLRHNMYYRLQIHVLSDFSLLCYYHDYIVLWIYDNSIALLSI